MRTSQKSGAATTDKNGFSALFFKTCQKNSLKEDQGIYEQIKNHSSLSRGGKLGKKSGFITWATKEPKSVKTKTQKQNNPIPTLVNRGFAIHQQLLVLNEEFKQIKERLKAEAESRPNEHIPLLDKDSTGEQWVILGDGCECRIVFPADQLKSELDPFEPLFQSVKGLAGNHFKTLFQKVTLFEARDKKAFRSQVVNLLKPEKATKLLNLCSSPSEPKASWKARPTGKAQS